MTKRSVLRFVGQMTSARHHRPRLAMTSQRRFQTSPHVSNAQTAVIRGWPGERAKSTRCGPSGVFSQARNPGRRTAVRARGSPRVSGAKRASDAASFLVLASADREFIVDIGEDRDGCVEPSRHAAAKLQPSDLTFQRHDVRPRIDGIGVSPPIAPEIGVEIRLPYLTTRGDDRPFGPEPDAPARPRRIAERDIAKPVIVVPEAKPSAIGSAPPVRSRSPARVAAKRRDSRPPGRR